MDRAPMYMDYVGMRFVVVAPRLFSRYNPDSGSPYPYTFHIWLVVCCVRVELCSTSQPDHVSRVL
jgi:hypothetical protein